MTGSCVLDTLMEFNLTYRRETPSDMGNELILFPLNGGNHGSMSDLQHNPNFSSVISGVSVNITTCNHHDAKGISIVCHFNIVKL